MGTRAGGVSAAARALPVGNPREDNSRGEQDNCGADGGDVDSVHKGVQGSRYRLPWTTSALRRSTHQRCAAAAWAAPAPPGSAGTAGERRHRRGAPAPPGSVDMIDSVAGAITTATPTPSAIIATSIARTAVVCVQSRTATW